MNPIKFLENLYSVGCARVSSKSEGILMIVSKILQMKRKASNKAMIDFYTDLDRSNQSWNVVCDVSNFVKIHAQGQI